MTKAILIIDDDNILLETLASNLQTNDLIVLTAPNTNEASKILQIITPDTIILDRMMPGKDGLTYLKEIRSKNIQIPVLMLTALGDSESIISGLETGANDYLPKPFNFKELKLRINNLLKISNNDSNSKSIITKQNNEFFINKKQIKLSIMEKNILSDLLNYHSDIVKISDLSTKYNINDKNIPMIIKRLRMKINCDTNRIEIQNIYKQGYKLIEKDE